MTEEQLKSILWDRFMDKLRIPTPVGSDEEPQLPVNFLGSAESYRKLFMEIEIPTMNRREK
jgi:hypothetical protein